MTDGQAQPDGAVAPASTFHLGLDGNQVVVSKSRSNCPQPGMVDVDEATYGAAVVNGSRYVDGALRPYTPPPPPPPIPQVTAKQVLYALNHLGFRAQWDAAWSTQKQDDRDWFGLGGDPFPITHKRIARLLGAAGLDAGKVTAQAQAE